MLILITAHGIFTFTDLETIRAFERDVGAPYWSFFTVVDFGEGAQPC